MNHRQFFKVIKEIQEKMPKCLNDISKTYKGDEPSPKGLGYAAGSETVGHKMRGKDGNMWIVQETKTCKKWAKCKDEPKPKTIIIDFDKLPPTCYHKVYIPTTVKIVKENGCEDKFGGDVPFFIKGESWPMYKKVPQTFFCQLRDPRKDDNILYRIFIAVDNDYECANYHITKIILNEENLKNQIIIPKPNYDGKDNYGNGGKLTKFPAYKITKWTIEDELKYLDTILQILKINKDDDSFDYDTFRDDWCDKNNGSNGIKVGGTPDFTQCADEKMRKKYNFLQLTDRNILPYGWGDCGIAHITDNCELYWDCC
jgi:hypothetical protein